MRRALLILALLAGAIAASAQSVVLYDDSFTDSSGKPLTGILWVQPTLLNGTPTSYHFPGGGTTTSTAVPAPVSSGSFSITLADTSLTFPVICFNLAFNNVLGKGYSCVQPSATGQSSWCTTMSDVTRCNLADYLPSSPPQTSTPYVSGINGIPGAFIFTGAGVSYNSATQTFTFSSSGSITYPGAGLATSTGTAWRAPVFGDVVALFASGSCSGLLKSDGTCVATSSFDAAGVAAADESAAIGTAETVAASLYAARSGATFTGTLAATALVDFSASTSPMKVPVIAGCTTTASGQECHDSTNHNWHDFDNSVDNFVAIFPSATPPTSGHAAGFLKTGNVWTLQDLGLLGSAAFDAASAFDAAGAAATAQAAAIAASDASGAAASVQAASLQKSSNLSDLASASAARTNLGLGSAATQSTSAFDAAGAAAAAQSAAIAASDASGAAATALSSAETFSANASNISSGTLNHARLPSLLSADIPNNAANTSGNAANLSGTPLLPTGTTAATGTAGESDTNVATNAQVANATRVLILSTGTGITVPGNTVATPVFQTPGGSLSFVNPSTNHQIGLGLSGTLVVLTVCINSTQPSGGALTVDVAMATTVGATPAVKTLTVPIASTSASGCYSDTTDSDAYTSTSTGPGFTYQITNASPSTSAAIVSIAIYLKNPH